MLPTAWGAVAGGAFFAARLFIFLALAVGGAVAVAAFNRLEKQSWLWVGGLTGVAAVTVSGIASHSFVSIAYGAAPILAATALGAIGAVGAFRGKSDDVRRAISDVAGCMALVTWLGVSFHLPTFAALQAEGWRGEGTFGYANADATFLLLGLFCTLATIRPGDRVGELRAFGIIVGLGATQSRATIVALVVAIVIFWLMVRPWARQLLLSGACAAVALVGLLPSVQSSDARPIPATIMLLLGTVLLVWRGASRRWVVVCAVLALAAGAVGLRGLQTRVVDSGSDSGRLHLWHVAISDIARAPLVGEGPAQIASFSRGHLIDLFVHNDFLQVVVYYGAVGAAALLLSCALLVRRWSFVNPYLSPGDRGLGLSTVVAMGICGLVDFPFEVPLILGTSLLVVGSVVGTPLHVGADAAHTDGAVGAKSATPASPSRFAYSTMTIGSIAALIMIVVIAIDPIKGYRSVAPTLVSHGGVASLPLDLYTGVSGQVVTVTAASSSASRAVLQAWDRRGTGWIRVGPAMLSHVAVDGMTEHPREGLAATPEGSFRLAQAFGSLPDPGTRLQYSHTGAADWWISQAGRLYNTHQVCLAECAFRLGAPNTHLIDYVPAYNYALVIAYNVAPAVQGAGSGYFLHVSTAGAPTNGCVSTSQDNLASLLRWLNPRDDPRILIGVV